MSVKVAVRVRPFNQRQKFLGCLNCIQMKEKTTILINPRDRSQKQHQFTFDYSFWSHDGYEELQNGYFFPIDDRFIDQKRIFKQLGDEIIKSAWNGFNCCLFAYGQTGAGKSYSMIGYENNRGIVPMACEKIFQGISKKRVKGKIQFELSISMLQIYNEKVQDLFVHTSKRPPNGLRIRENKRVGVYVQGITKIQVHSYHEIQRRMEEGAKNRSLASTLMNEYSSRAHTIVIIEFIQKQFITEQKMNKKTSTLNLVDLAGSERVSKTGISDRDRLKEASQINKSLHTLGRVIEHLAEIAAGKKNVQVPYRDSVLTRILETALGGNSMTTMICAVSPANDNYEQTLSTLRYADQAKKIKNRPIINQSAVDKIIRELREENERLKEMLKIAKLKGINIEKMFESGDNIQEEDLLSNIQEIQREIKKTMQSFAINTDNFEGEDTDNIMISEFIDVPDPNDFYSGDLSFQNPFSALSSSPHAMDSSITTIGNSKSNVYITNLSEDALLSFKIKYSCQNELFIGNKNLKDGNSAKFRLILCGLGVEDRHARIFQVFGKSQADSRFFIQALGESAGEYTIVNGRPILYDLKHGDLAHQAQGFKKKGLRELFHNDRLIFGTNSIFIFKNLRQSSSSSTSPNKKPVGKHMTSQGTGIAIGTDADNSAQKKSRNDKRKSFLLQDGNDNDESMLLDWNEGENDGHGNSIIDNLKKVSLSSQNYDVNTSKADLLSNDIYVGTEQPQPPIPQEFIDYEFAINERQNYLFETSSSSTGTISPSRINMNPHSHQQQEQMQKKLEEIESEFQELVKENERKLKEKEEAFREELRRIEEERVAERKKLREELREKEEEAERIAREKEEMLRVKEELIKEREKRRLQPVQQQTEDKTKIEYVDRHHFHTDFHIIQSHQHEHEQLQTNQHTTSTKFNSQNINKKQNTNTNINTNINIIKSNTEQNSMFQEKISQPSFNTTTTSNQMNMTGVNVNEQSMLLDVQAQEAQDTQRHFSSNAGNNMQKKKESQHYSAQTGQASEAEEKKQEINAGNKKQQQQEIRKRSLNLTDILYAPNPDTRQRCDSKASSDQENLLLNITNGEGLISYIPAPKQQHQQYNPSKKIDPESMLIRRRSSSSSNNNISLNYSLLTDVQEQQQHMDPQREEQLNNKIQQLEEKLRQLENSKQQNQESIKNLKKSFAMGAQLHDNFYTENSKRSCIEELSNYQDMGEFDLSMIEAREENDGVGGQTGEGEGRTLVEKKLKKVMVQAENENIINERNLQVRKRKREADEIKDVFIKKSKKDLHKQLVQLIPMLQKFNLWGREMGRNLQGKVHIEYRNFTNYEIIDSLKNNRNFCRFCLMVKIMNYEEGRSYKWTVEIFKNRYEILENLFERFLENPGSQFFSDKNKDPFWDPRDFQAYAVAYLTLQPLAYGLAFHGEICFVEKQQIVAYMEISLEPTIDRKQSKLRQKIHNQYDHAEEEIQDPRKLLETNLFFTISIDNIRFTEHLSCQKIQKYCISYELIEDSYKTQTFKTAQMPIKKKQINYMFKHSFRNVTENTLAYLADCPVKFTISIVFDYDDEMSHMTSSFISQGQGQGDTSFLNTSGFSDRSDKSKSSSVALSSSESGGSPPVGFVKKKPAVFMENSQVLSKIDIDFASEKKKAKQEKEAKEAKRALQEAQLKKKDKNKDSCRHS